MGSRLEVMLTGATGFVGGALASRLLDEGAQVTALVRDPARAEALARRGVRLVQGSVADRRALSEACAPGQIVVHGAARASDWGPLEEFVRDNVDGTRNVAEAALAAGCARLVHMSSISVYGFDPPAVVDEDTPLPVLADDYPYGESKRLAEQVVDEVARRGLSTVVARLGSVYGPGSGQWTLRPARLAKTPVGLVLVDGGRGLHNHVYIDNLVDGLRLCMEHPAAPGGVFNLTDGEPTPYREFFGHYARMVRGDRARMIDLGRRRALATAWLLEKAGQVTRRPVPITRVAVRLLMRRSAIRSDRARRLLGYEPIVGLEEGMAACQRWLAELGVVPG
jgi:nucleoside-diphosphate-sugar epimerase